jgi:hypothetical protein
MPANSQMEIAIRRLDRMPIHIWSVTDSIYFFGDLRSISILPLNPHPEFVVTILDNYNFWKTSKTVMEPSSNASLWHSFQQTDSLAEYFDDLNSTTNESFLKYLMEQSPHPTLSLQIDNVHDLRNNDGGSLTTSFVSDLFHYIKLERRYVRAGTIIWQEKIEFRFELCRNTIEQQSRT